MATLNLSTHGPSISSSYKSIVNAPAPSGPAANSPTYGQWSLFSVSTPLVNAFQQNAPQKESVLKVQSTGEGELIDLIEDFSDGRIQFAFVKVKDPNTGLPKNVLIAWCGEGVPERTKGYFTSHLAAITKFFDGYHVQVTARSDRDLSPEAIVQKVADSSGSKYSGGNSPQPPVAANKPPVASKPAFNPTQTTSSFKPLGATRQTPSNRQDVDEDGWGADAPQVTRTQLEKVVPAYQPTKVNMKELMSQKGSSTSGAGPDRSMNESQGDVVRGGYQPIGKVDIAAIRRQAREAGQGGDDRPAPVKGSYEPVGKVDIAAIRAKAQGGDSPSAPSSRISPAVTGASGDSGEPKSLAERSSAFNSSERLTTLPKPKVANKFGSGSTFTGTKAPLPGEFGQKASPSAAPIGVASRTFADEGGKTPAQIWAEKKAKQQGGAIPPPSAPLPEQQTGGQDEQGGWKSTYTGKSWAPVQTTHTGASSGPVDAKHEEEEQAEDTSAGGVGSIRERFANVSVAENTPQMASYERSAPSPPPLDTNNKPSATREVPPPLPVHPGESDVMTEQAREPSPPPVESPPGSPIRVAMPVGRGSAEEPAADIHEDHRSPPPSNLPATAAQNAPAPKEAQGDVHGEGIKAVAQYDYEKTEDNEIEMREGELITNIDMIDEDWWLGVNSAGASGLFPRNYVEVVEEGHGNESHDTHAAPASHVEAHQEREVPAPEAAKSRGPTATALYDYEMTEDNEIGFPEDAKIINIQFPDEDWWLGEYKGKVGLFPANYVELDDK